MKYIVYTIRFNHEFCTHHISAIDELDSLKERIMLSNVKTLISLRMFDSLEKAKIDLRERSKWIS